MYYNYSSILVNPLPLITAYFLSPSHLYSNSYMYLDILSGWCHSVSISHANSALTPSIMSGRCQRLLNVTSVYCHIFLMVDDFESLVSFDIRSQSLPSSCSQHLSFRLDGTTMLIKSSVINLISPFPTIVFNLLDPVVSSCPSLYPPLPLTSAPMPIAQPPLVASPPPHWL